MRLWQKARELAYGQLTCMGRHTVTGMLTSSGQQFKDWSASYRLFSKHRVDTSKLFDHLRSAVLEDLHEEGPIIAHMDDTLLKKTGRHVPGTSWRRDPLGPPFHTNFIWGQRFLQISLALADQPGCCQSRAIPVDFHHCPTVKKPSRSANEEQWKDYREQKHKARLSRQGSDRIRMLRDKLNQQGYAHRELILSVDGSYTNSEVIKNLPKAVTLVGRVRKDTKLYNLPESQKSAGRKRVYGERLPTPEQIRQSDLYHWQKVRAWAAGREHDFKVKIVKNVRWRSAGAEHDLQLVVIRPLGYRLTKKSRVLYRQPAYLICTDTDLDIETLLQAYLWRWEIEVNFREEKTLLGCGQAQVVTTDSAELVPAFVVVLYGMLLVAKFRSMKRPERSTLPRPKWYPKQKNIRDSCGDTLNEFRAQLWAKAIGINFSSFVNQYHKTQSLRNTSNPCISNMLYHRN